jgi:hypothetical protein
MHNSIFEQFQPFLQVDIWDYILADIFTVPLTIPVCVDLHCLCHHFDNSMLTLYVLLDGGSSH